MPNTARKRFVSVYFTSNKLQAVFLSADKKTVEKAVSVEIGQGIIVGRRVKETQKLSEILKELWTKYDIREKYVGVVVPEFSTYIKTFQLPPLGKDELDEAVRWQAADVIPSSEQTVLDWKILEDNKEGITVLAASIKKDILSGYLEAIAKAGLYPLVLETPSLSVVRLSDHQDFGKLIIYLASDEALLVIAKGDKIFGSSITNLGDENIVQTAVRISGYYSDVKIEKVLVGGSNITQNLFAQLKEKFKVDPQWLVAQVEGLSPQQLQEYLVSISLQYKDPTEPRDEKTVNLLPMDWAKNYENKRFKKRMRMLGGVAASFLLTILLVAGTVNFMYQRKVSELQQTIISQTSQQDEELVKQAQEANKLAEKIIKVSKPDTNLESVLTALGEARPAGVSVTNYSINFQESTATLNGVATDRLSLIQFKKNLDGVEEFSEVDLPLSLLEKDTDINFEIEILLKSAERDNAGVVTIPDDILKQ